MMECSICFDEVKKPVDLLSCDHQFCGDCLRQWAAEQRAKSQQETCPVCRAPALDDFQTILGCEETKTLIFVRNGIIMIAREDADDMVPSEATLYDTCVAELGPEGTEVMLTRISCLRNWEAFRVGLTLDRSIDELTQFIDMPITSPEGKFQALLRDYRALRRSLRHLMDTIMMTHQFSADEGQPLFFSDFFNIRMAVFQLTNDPQYEGATIELQIT